MAKKKKEQLTAEEKANIKEIYAQEAYIERLAQKMYDSGENVSITNIYHKIKDRMGLPGYYVFAYGDAIKDVLREAGWIRGGGMGPI